MKKVKLHEEKAIIYVWICPYCGIENEEEGEGVQVCLDESFVSECENCGKEVEVKI